MTIIKYNNTIKTNYAFEINEIKLSKENEHKRKEIKKAIIKRLDFLNFIMRYFVVNVIQVMFVYLCQVMSLANIITEYMIAKMGKPGYVDDKYIVTYI